MDKTTVNKNYFVGSKMKILFLVSWCLGGVLLAGCATRPSDEQQRAFLGANGRYESGDYSGALAGYMRLTDAGLKRTHLHYNIANCQLKLGVLGKAILYYERCLLLAPRDEDAKYNLAFARSQTVDEINPPGGLEAIGAALGGGGLFSRREVWIVTMLLYILFFLLMVLMRIGPRFKPLAYFRAGVLSLFVLVSMLYLYLNWRQEAKTRGVVMVSEATVRNEPRADGAVEFKLHEGTVVRLLRVHEGWQAVYLRGELKGWLRQADVEKI